MAITKIVIENDHPLVGISTVIIVNADGDQSWSELHDQSPLIQTLLDAVDAVWTEAPHSTIKEVSDD